MPAGPTSDTHGWRQFAAPLLGIFALALALRIVYLWQIRDAPYFTLLMGDARSYDAWARRIAAGDWIGSEVFYQAPLYPYFLGIIYRFFGHDLVAVRVVQSILGAAGATLLGHAVWRLFGKQAGIVGGIVRRGHYCAQRPT